MFVLGDNGAGKTTLSKTIVGFYAPTSGEVLWNGTSVADTTREAYRNRFAVTFADCHVFDEIPAVDAAGRAAEVKAHIDLFELNDIVQVNGGAFSKTKLSMGQRKRLALIDDRPFYVPDEWAADQDPHFRAIFYERILP